jgi:hypothetical protein
VECFVLNDQGYLVKSIDQSCQYQVLLADSTFNDLVEPNFYIEYFIFGFTAVASIWFLSFAARKVIQTIRYIG